MKRLSCIALLFPIILYCSDLSFAETNVQDIENQIQKLQKQCVKPIKNVQLNLGYGLDNPKNEDVSSEFYRQSEYLFGNIQVQIMKDITAGIDQPPYLFLRIKSLGFPAALGGPTSPSSSINSIILAALL